jgi:undecaprenyl-diphosphatase
MTNKLLPLLLSLFFSTGLFAQSLDLRILEKINSPGDHGDNTWRFVSKSALYIGAATPVAMIVTGFANHDDKLKLEGYETGVSLIIAGTSQYILKGIVKRDRPFVTYPNLITPKTHETDYSFPSGHASFVFADAMSLSLSFPKWYVIAPSFAYATTVGYSRLYLGVHYPSDVLGGAVLGVASSYLTWHAQRWINKKRHPVTN